MVIQITIKAQSPVNIYSVLIISVFISMTPCKLIFSRGSIYLVGNQVNFVAKKWQSLLKEKIPDEAFTNRTKRDGEDFHITLADKKKVTDLSLKKEMDKALIFEEISIAVKDVDLSSFVDIGVGKVSDEENNVTYFVIVSFAKLRHILKQIFGSDDSVINLHITLAFNPVDVHLITKNFDSLMQDPFNYNLIAVKCVIDEIKALIVYGYFADALKVIECIKKSQLDAKINEIKALALFKMGRYEECHQVTEEILEIVELPIDIKVLAFIRQSDALLASRNYRKALYPIYGALHILHFDEVLMELKKTAKNHLMQSLQKCARNGYLRIDVLPVSRKNIQEKEKSLEINDDGYFFKILNLFKKFNLGVYNEIISSIETEEITHEAFDENFMPLESRWISGSSGTFHVLPRNFSYLWPNKLAISSTPRHKLDIQNFSDLGINLVITLTEEEPLKPEWFEVNNCQNLFIPVSNYQPPSVSETDRIVWEIARSPGKVLIHCGGGKGRAGTAAGCVIMTLGMNPGVIKLCPDCSDRFRPFGTCSQIDCHFSKTPIYDPITCLNIIRSHRPESLETIQQEAFLKTYSNILWQRSTIPNSKESSFLNEEMCEDTLEIFGSLPNKFPRFIILSGLPGSGKTTFAKKLVEKMSEIEFEVYHVNQDAVGGREAFEDAIGSAVKLIRRSIKSVLIVDRCNARKKDRKNVLDLLQSPETDHVVLIHFDITEKLCMQRIEQRFNHLTLKPEDGKRAVKHFSEILEIPEQISEGCLALFVIKSIADSNKALELMLEICSRPRCNSKLSNLKKDDKKADKMDNFYKFPRTEHLFNLGGATRDDLVLSPEAFKTFFKAEAEKVITMEEKIDGANLGFSIDSEGKIKCQNRSHYVDSKYHFQFQALGSYIYQKKESLENVLKNGRILYGEWMFAKHSIHYTKLPDVFIAFDIFDTNNQKFLDRATFRKIMSETDIKFVQPLVTDPESYSTRESLEKLLKDKVSNYSDSIIEGIYFRWDQNGHLKTRAKLVRSDFIDGTEHWAKGKVVLNVVI